MKGGKDNGSVMDPMFPRLHIDDADKGGPRPPPRNKMSVPVSNGRGCVVPRASPINIGAQQKIVFIGAEKPDLVVYNEKSSFLKESKNIIDDMSRMPERITRKRCYSEIEDSSRSFPLDEDKNMINKDEAIKECYDEESNKHISDTSGDSFEGVDITSEDVVGAIGQTLFLKARAIIVQQQKLFAVQIFELHRLIKVQTLISENNSNLKKPCIKFPPINKLLYVTSLEQSSPLITKQKVNDLKSNPSQHDATYAISRQLAPRLNNVEKRQISQRLSPKPLNFNSLPVNQWLVPVKSPSEGVAYNPNMGHCPPAVGVVSPIYGNYAPMCFSPIDGHTAYGFPANAIGQSYFQPYAVPMLNSSCRRLDIDQSTRVLSKCEDDRENRPREKFQEELYLFPTTPSNKAPRCDEQRVQAIKVVPRNARSAAKSAAWTFRSIQEERNTCLHV